jgi:mannose-6-phosphate isomerase-like protein (cupin superfamily)
MERTEIESVSNTANPAGNHSVRRAITPALDASDVALVQYKLEPGDSLSGGLHTHYDQEEIFYTQEGSVAFTVVEEPGGERQEITVDSGEIIRFAPGEFQTGKNERDAIARVLAIGAPGTRHDDEQIGSLVDCRECDEETAHGVMFLDDGGMELTCRECSNSFVVGD